MKLFALCISSQEESHRGSKYANTSTSEQWTTIYTTFAIIQGQLWTNCLATMAKEA